MIKIISYIESTVVVVVVVVVVGSSYMTNKIMSGGVVSGVVYVLLAT